VDRLESLDRDIKVQYPVYIKLLFTSQDIYGLYVKAMPKCKFLSAGIKTEKESPCNLAKNQKTHQTSLCGHPFTSQIIVSAELRCNLFSLFKFKLEMENA
jgi:hypothetical protein